MNGTEGRDFRVEGNDTSGYVGVSAEYRTYANEINKPISSEEDLKFFERHGIQTDDEAAKPDTDDDEDEDDNKSRRSTRRTTRASASSTRKSGSGDDKNLAPKL